MDLYVFFNVFRVLYPNEFQRRRALVGALSEILWQAGEKKRCCVCLKESESMFGPDYRYKFDGITENVRF